MKLTNFFKKRDGHYSIMIVPHASARMKTLKIRHNSIRIALIAVLVVLVVLTGWTTFLTFRTDYSDESAGLKRDKLVLENQLAEVKTKLALLETNLERLEKFDRKLRIMTNFADNTRKVGIGPLTQDEMIASNMTGITGSNEALALKLKEKLGELESADLSNEIDRLLNSSSEKEKELAELTSFLEDQRLLINRVPAIWPAEGWVTSGFGYRHSPFTSSSVFHEGLDIANNVGTPIYAAADGVVVFTANHEGYGRMIIINHGFGLSTRYGHLSEYKRNVGDRVKRGDLIATMGNTGRSTGPHLHYEVRLNNIPQNPLLYILD